MIERAWMLIGVVVLIALLAWGIRKFDDWDDKNEP